MATNQVAQDLLNMELGRSHVEKEVSELDDSADELDNAGSGLMMTTLRSKLQFVDVLAGNSGNRMISDDNAEDLLMALSTDDDVDVCYTYKNGKRAQDDDSATRVNIAIYYIPGADLAEVNMMENKQITREKASQKSAKWRVLTAGNMLRELEVQRDLKIKVIDKTTDVLAQYKRRTQRSYNPAANVAGVINKSLLKLGDEDKLVNIDSKNVFILNEFSEKKSVDLESTCIEIDGTSLLNLIYNFRDLISNRGKYATLLPEETVMILETMIEDARRLLVRSPILTRVATRIAIQKSRNTRYGFDTGAMFHTFTTSKGIGEIIQQGVSYYSALQGAKEVQAKVRPKFMQMVVFLVSLLNDEDLEGLRPALEQSYDLKADRKSIELTILKVFTCFAVSPHLFLEAVISAFAMKRVEIKDSEESESREWDHFLSEAARLGWLIPGTMEYLGRKSGSWKVRWRKFKDSDVFDHLQYCGEKDAVNFIPPLKIYSDTLSSQEVSAEFRNGQTYSIAAKDLDNITLAIKNRYTMTHPETGIQSDLVVKEEVLFKEVDQVAAELEEICNAVNDAMSYPEEKSQKRKAFLSPGRFKSTKPQQQFSFQKPSGLRTKNTITVLTGDPLKEEVIAISWKLDGRKITYRDLLKGINADLNVMNNMLASLGDFAGQQKKRLSERPNDLLRGRLDLLVQRMEAVSRTIDYVENVRAKMMSTAVDKDEEPIIRVHFPSQIHSMQDLPWCRYTQVCLADTSQLSVNSERYLVAEPPQWKANIASLKLGDGSQIATVAPLTQVDDEDKDEEVSKSDTVLLLGGLVVVLDLKSQNDVVVNYLKLTALDRVKKRRRRGGDDEGPVPLQESVLV